MPELTLCHSKARAYSPTLGRFLQTDPTGDDDGLNLYAYVGNDPVNGIPQWLRPATVKPNCATLYMCLVEELNYNFANGTHVHILRGDLNSVRLFLNRKAAIPALLFWSFMGALCIIAFFYEDALTKPRTIFFYIWAVTGIAFCSIQVLEWLHGVRANLQSRYLFNFSEFPFAVKVNRIREVEQTDKEIFLHMVGGGKKRINLKFTTNRHEFINAILHRIQVQAFD